MVRFITWLLLTAAFFYTAIGACQVNTQRHEAKKQVNNAFETNEYWGKGGLGIINDKLYIVLKSDRNELLSAGDKWTGQEAVRPEVVICFDGKILPAQSVPDGFDLSKSIVVSFEGEKVRFFDFNKMSGGYYRRLGR